jgi:hypothetical protein
MKNLFTFALVLSVSNTIAQNVGVDVATPLQKLDVAGGIRIGTSSSAIVGSIRFNAGQFEVCVTNGVWIPLASMGPTGPTGAAGADGTDGATGSTGAQGIAGPEPEQQGIQGCRTVLRANGTSRYCRDRLLVPKESQVEPTGMQMELRDLKEHKVLLDRHGCSG